jgi:hypothetical protein
LTEFFISSFGPVEPCGLWQSEHAILAVLAKPVTASGWVEMRRVWARCALWQAKQTSAWVTLLSTFWSGAWMLWQSVQATPRLSCWVPCHSATAPCVWHWRQTALRCATGAGPRFVNEMNGLSRWAPADATCAALGPWHASQANPSLSFRGPFRNSLPILVAAKLSNCFGWQRMHGSAPPT